MQVVKEFICSLWVYDFIFDKMLRDIAEKGMKNYHIIQILE